MLRPVVVVKKRLFFTITDDQITVRTSYVHHV